MGRQMKIIKKIKNTVFFTFINQLIFRFKDDNLSGTSAQIAYYLILSFFPFLLFLINLLSFTSLSSDLLLTNFQRFLPQDSADWLKDILTQTVQSKSTVLLIVGMVSALWSSTKGVLAITRGLNKAYDVKEDRGIVKIRILSFLSAITLSVIIVLSLLTLVFGEIISTFIINLIGTSRNFSFVGTFLQYLISFFLIFFMFSLVYKKLPNRKLKFKEIWIGSIFSTFAWVGASLIFSIYVNNFANYSKVYGGIGGIIALLIWLFLTTLIILIGGEINAIYLYLKNKRSIDKYETFRLKPFEKLGLYD